MNNRFRFKQHDITDCGAACLASVAEFHGLKLPISKIRQYASTDAKGTNVLGMIEAAQKMKLMAKGVKGTFESLSKIPMPSIAHVIVKENLQHYVVIYKVTTTYILVMDPGDGKYHKIPIEEFKKQWTGVLILLLPDEDFEVANKTTPLKKRLWQLIKPHKAIMLQALFGALIYSVLGLSTSIYVEKIIDYVLVDSNYNLLNLLGVIMVFILLLRTFIGVTKSIFMLKTGQKIDATLILAYYMHLMQLPQQFFDSMRVGEIISRLNDALKIHRFINDIVLDLFVNVLIIVFTILLMFSYSWKLSLLILISFPLFFVVFTFFNRANKLFLRKIMEKSATLETHLVESINSMRTIKQLGLEDYSNEKTEEKFISLLQSSYKSSRAAIFTINANEFIAIGLTISLLWFGSQKVLELEITPGDLMSFYALLGYLISPIRALITANQPIQDALIAADRLFQIFDLDREEQKSKQIELTNSIIGDIKFENVSFRYGTRKEVFNGLNLTLQKGKTIAIIGESGSGKTTLVSLLQKIYPIAQGKILIGNYDINLISRESLRQKVSIVPQKIELFAGNILSNIAIDDPEPDLKRVVDICKEIGILEFIEHLPNGFETDIGENGASLSGGEKQRIAIARAIYRNPEVFIFDEATSSLDSVAEQFIQNFVTKLKEQGKTIIITAHRLSTIKRADEIVVLKNGNVLEKGTHNELLSLNSEYKKLWEMQSLTL